MGVNWDLLQPIRPVAAQEVASVNGLLSAFAERRMKQQQFEAQQALAERSFQSQEANRRHDNANADAMLRLQQRQYESAQEQAKAAALAKDQDQARAELDKTILPALQNDRPDQAEASAIAAGVGFGKREADLAPGQVPPEAPTTRYNLTLPAGQVINYDPIEAENAKKAATAKLIEKSRAALEPTRRIDPYMNTAVDLALGMAPLYQKPEDVAKLATAEHDKAQAQAAAAANAREMASATNARHQATVNQGAVRELNTEVKAFANENKIPDLNKAKERFGQSLAQLEEGLRTDNPKSMAAGVDSLISGYKNGTVTGAALQYFTKDSSSWLERAENLKAKILGGGYSPTTVNEFINTVKSGLSQINHELETKERAFNKSTYDNPSYADLWSNVNAHHDRLFPGIDTRSTEPPPGDQAGVTLTGKDIKRTGKPASPKSAPASAETIARLKRLEEALGAYADRIGGSQ